MRINEHKRAEQIILKSTFVNYQVRFHLRYVSKKKKPDFLKWLQNQQLGAIPETKCS